MFTKATDFLNKKVKVKIDRPLGSKHPKYDFIYPVNYGFVPGTLSPDREELDAYILEVDKPLDYFEGICIAVIHRLNDEDDKLVVVPEESINISDEEIKKQVDFQEQFFDFIVLRS